MSTQRYRRLRLVDPHVYLYTGYLSNIALLSQVRNLSLTFYTYKQLACLMFHRQMLPRQN